ncbi:MAG: hypothetical protein COB36_14790 [Alphaproteobacteria bacterium]|nr:MAG: hypothetical protein COB36_14790 [Alphaproteobacteria bacterium]
MANMTVEMLHSDVEDAIRDGHTTRTEAYKARQYYDGQQWTLAEIKELNRRKQPIVTINRVRKKCNGVLGLDLKRPTDPVALPRTPEADGAASVATKILRFAEENTKADNKLKQVKRDITLAGYGAIEVTVKESGEDYELDVTHYHWQNVFFDPHSREVDFSDAGFLGTFEWMNTNKAISRYNKGEKLIRASIEEGSGSGDDTADDKPSFLWSDKSRNRVRIVRLWKKDGQVWRFYTFVKGGILEENESPFQDKDGQTVCPLLLESCYVDFENNRYGIVRDMFSPQDETNQSRSRLLFELSDDRFFYNQAAIQDIGALRGQLQKRDGAIAIQHGIYGQDFGFVRDAGKAQGQSARMDRANQEMNELGINPALIGRDSQGQSGRAILAQQDGAIAEEAPVFDRLQNITQRVYEAMWQRIQQFWTAPRIIRITGDKRAPEFLKLNTPELNPETGMIQYRNRVQQMDVDVIIDQKPDTATLAGEQFTEFMKLASANPQLLEEIGTEALIKMSSLPDKQAVLDILEEKQKEKQAQQQQQGQAQAQQMQQVQMLAMQEQMAKLEKLVADTGLVKSKSQHEQAKTAQIINEQAAPLPMGLIEQY